MASDQPTEDDEDRKEPYFVASSRSDLKSFPKDARSHAGYEIYRVETGKSPRNFDSLSHIRPGLMEIKVDHDTDTYRVVYVAKFSEAVYVIDAFQKKSPSGSKLPKNIRERIENRYDMVDAERPAVEGAPVGGS